MFIVGVCLPLEYTYICLCYQYALLCSMLLCTKLTNAVACSFKLPNVLLSAACHHSCLDLHSLC